MVYQIKRLGITAKTAWAFNAEEIRERQDAGLMGDFDTPLLIGGRKPIQLENGEIWRGGVYEVESMRGYINEIRVSRGWVYGSEGRFRPKRKLRVDKDTIALWRFGRGNLLSDSSGNGYNLQAGGSLAVEPHTKLTTTWGWLKKQKGD